MEYWDSVQVEAEPMAFAEGIYPIPSNLEQPVSKHKASYVCLEPEAGIAVSALELDNQFEATCPVKQEESRLVADAYARPLEVANVAL